MDRLIIVSIVVERGESGIKKPPQARWLVKHSKVALFISVTRGVFYQEYSVIKLV